MADKPQSVSDPTPSADSPVGEMIVSEPRARMRARWAELVFIIALSCFALVALLANRYAYFEWDLKLARRIQSVSLPGFDVVMSAVSLLGNAPIAWPMVVIVGMGLIGFGLRMEGIICMAGPALGSLGNSLLKLWIGRPRPSDALVHVAGAYKHDSFPSGHVVFFVEFFGFVFFLTYVLLRPGLLRRALLIVSGSLIVLVGVSRVYLGAHWPSDVLGAFLAGGMWLMILIEVYRRIKAKGKRELKIEK